MTADATGGLKVEKYEEGTGTPAQAGKMVRVHYTGTLENGQKFDSSRDRGEPIEFPLGVGYVIQGWDQGIAQLRVGDKARLTVPAHLGYGDAGVPGCVNDSARIIVGVAGAVCALGVGGDPSGGETVGVIARGTKWA